MLELIDITKGYGIEGIPGYVPVLKSLSLKLSTGESMVVLGPSGCGKSTLLNIIGALDKPSSGNLRFMEKDFISLDEEKLAFIRNQEIGFVFQMHHLLPHLTVLENVFIPTLAYPDRSKSESIKKRAEELIDKMGISDCIDRRPGELSGGQRQRAAVARALINSPKLLLADEPTGSLDHETAVSVMNLLSDLNRTENIALVVVTHAAYLARQFDKVYTLRDGKLIEDNPEKNR
ncbi:MAG: ABC transporter ATP-binding protein [Desulfobacteraceae bacterium]|jgi:ABC-type lipoprotein export system ATPase subunit